ncbi:MAG: hypothetical protein V2A73_11220 [Pseudomonadota bacterium]
MGLVTVFLAAFCVACGDESGADGLSVNGSVVGTAVPANAKVVVVWLVMSSGSPDYTYKYGEGTSTNASFVVTMTADPPAQAIDSSGFGVGYVMLVASDAQIPDGIVTKDQLQPFGLSARYAIIWKNATVTDIDWTTAFPAGFMCGRCVPASDGEIFDGYEPVDCSQVQIETATDIETLDVCNWT